MTRASLNQTPVTAPDLPNEADHFQVCGTCGQAFDRRKLGDVMHHLTDEHEALARQ